MEIFEIIRPTMPQHQQSLQETRNTESGEVDFPGKSTQMVSPEKIHTSNLQTKKFIFRNIYPYAYMHVTTMNKERGHGLEREHRGLCGRVGRQERDGRDDIIMF